MFAKRYILPLVALTLLVFPLPLAAQKPITQHFITASVAGGSGLGMSCGEMISPVAGADGQIALSYEVLRSGFFFSFGIGADYRLSRFNMKNQMVDQFPSPDRDGVPVLYRYVYSGYREQEHTLYGSVPVWFGYRIKDKVYFSLGAKVSMPLWNTYSVTTDMYTEGKYVNLIDVVSRDVPSYGYYPTVTYGYKGSYKAPALMVSPMAEVGGFIRLVPGYSLRIGAYVEYAVPVAGKHNTADIVDYSSVDTNPLTRNRENLQSNIRFNSVLNAHMDPASTAYAGQNVMKSVSQFISFGIRATFRFNVTRTPSVCMCEIDN